MIVSNGDQSGRNMERVMTTLDDDHDPAEYRRFLHRLKLFSQVAVIVAALMAIANFGLALTCHCNPPARVGSWLESVMRT